MTRAALPIAIAAGAVLALPGVAAADVFVNVPRAFLGGPIAPPVPVVTDEPAGGASRAPATFIDSCEGEAPDLCTIVGSEADLEILPEPRAEDGPGAEGIEAPDVDPEDPDLAAPADGAVEAARRPRSRVVAPPPTPALRRAFGRLRAPAPAAWLPWQRPTLRWGRTAGADYHNVQVFRGKRRVLNSWTRGTALRAPEGALKQGRTYVWTVFPGFGRRSAARYGPAIGRSTFEVTLRPRLVFRRPGRARGVVAEIRPRIPHATLRLTAPRALASRVPDTVTIDRRGRFTLLLTKRQAERLGARLLTQGTNPPIGLRG